MYDLQLWKVITFCPNSDFGVIRLYGRPIESSIQIYSFGGQFVLELAGKGRSGR